MAEATVPRLLNKKCVQYAVANNLACLFSRLITENNRSRTQSVLRQFMQCNRVDENEVNDIIH